MDMALTGGAGLAAAAVAVLLWRRRGPREAQPRGDRTDPPQGTAAVPDESKGGGCGAMRGTGCDAAVEKLKAA